MTRASKLKWAAFIAIDLALAVSLVFLFLVRDAANDLERLDELGTNLLPQAQPIRVFQLEDTQGQVFDQQRLAGKWSMVFYGFTNCPDVCPLTMAELGKFYRLLQAENSDLPLPQIIMVTVDPQRDNSAELRAYLDEYSEEFIGLTGSDRQLANLAEQLYVVSNTAAERSEHEGHMNMPQSSDGAQLFDHSGHISVINPDGELYAVMRLPHRDQYLLEAYQLLSSDWD
jgi:protein SCO1/2